MIARTVDTINDDEAFKKDVVLNVNSTKEYLLHLPLKTLFTDTKHYLKDLKCGINGIFSTAYLTSSVKKKVYFSGIYMHFYSTICAILESFFQRNCFPYLLNNLHTKFGPCLRFCKDKVSFKSFILWARKQTNGLKLLYFIQEGSNEEGK